MNIIHFMERYLPDIISLVKEIKNVKLDKTRRGRTMNIQLKTGFQPIDYSPQVLPSKPMVTFSPSTMTGTLRTPRECFNMVSS